MQCRSLRCMYCHNVELQTTRSKILVGATTAVSEVVQHITQIPRPPRQRCKRTSDTIIWVFLAERYGCSARATFSSYSQHPYYHSNGQDFVCLGSCQWRFGLSLGCECPRSGLIYASTRGHGEASRLSRLPVQRKVNHARRLLACTLLTIDSHVPAAPITDQFPYLGAKDGKPGTGKGGVLVPAPGDTAHEYRAPNPKTDIRG